MRNKIEKQKQKMEKPEFPGKYSGLCTNCDNRKDCKIRDKGFVVWRCEEYR